MDEEETGKMTTLFEHVTAVTMDREIPVIQDAYVAVEGTKIASVGTEPPEGTVDRWTAPGRCSSPALSTPTPTCP